MFLKLKTKHYFLTWKKKIILIMLIITMLICIFIIFRLNSKNNNVIQPNVNEVEKDYDSVSEETKAVIYGMDIKNKYKEVKDTDFAILVATINFLKGHDDNESKEHYKYILENEDTNIISVIKDEYGKNMDAIFVNYNRLLKDIVVIKDQTGGYITNYGFTDIEETKFNTYSENKSIVINDNSVFSEYPIYDGNYAEIGILYIEISIN
jgi:hypothetical protein